MPADSKTALIDYWRGVELLSPQPLDKLRGDDERVSRVDPSVPLPWHSAHPLRELWLGEKQAWRHLVFLGVHSLDRAFEDVRRVYPADEQMPDERPRAGESALCAFVVADDGRAVLASPVLASCAWAIGQALREGPASVGSASFERVASAFRFEWEEEVAAVPDDERARELEGQGWLVGRELDAEDLSACLELVSRLLELDQLPEDAELRHAREIRIVSRKVPAREAHAPGERQLLNSFYAEDLRKVGHAVAQGACGRALREYLTPAHRIDVGARMDVEHELTRVRRALSPHRIPLGRWPSAAAHVPSLGQQLALNEILSEGKREVWAVNGPPGTGKTVMLRDLLAALVVERAKRMAELDPSDAFEESLPWRGRRVHPPVAELCGYEVVLACATNAAAENVSAEIPAVEAIDSQWLGKGNYFSEVATNMLNPLGCDQPREAWAMVAAVLGSRARNKAFVSRWWWEGLRERLDRPASGSESESGLSWEQAVGCFRESLARVEEIQAEHAVYSDLLDAREDAVAELMRARKDAESASGDLELVERELVEPREAAAVATGAVARCMGALRTHGCARPSVVERVRTLGGAMRAWRLQRLRLNTALQSAEQAAGETSVRLASVEARAAELAALVERHEHARGATEARAREIQVELPGARERWEADFPDAVPADDLWSEPSERERRERCAPWIDSNYNAARVELFLAALALHRAFIEAAAPKMHASLRCATELISGQAGGDVSSQAARAAWQCLFLAVPLVSTTFASFPYVFRDLGHQQLGWLLIDEAGQATPQAAVGAIWRARRAVVVGDPLQLEPIVQLPRSIERVLRAEHHIDHARLRSDSSVQTLADQVCPLGTHRGRSADGLQPDWVGIPLNVHRRCESPMFEIVNHIAYGGQMLNCTPDRGELRLTGSHWIDVPNAPSSGNWIAGEGAALEQLLEGLRYEMVNFSEVFLITPFRAVAGNIGKHRRSYPGLTAGTIHTAQGREADIVILVLGGDSRRPGARAWAAEKPNLLNVAVSRARRRLYVIGDRAAWVTLPHFETLAAALQPLPSAQPLTAGRRLLGALSSCPGRGCGLDGGSLDM